MALRSRFVLVDWEPHTEVELRAERGEKILDRRVSRAGAPKLAQAHNRIRLGGCAGHTASLAVRGIIGKVNSSLRMDGIRALLR